ncbi:MAG: peptide chain release factor N(5)-glutamine methyltransferase [Bacteroidetes bacterium]|nr:peptide chain release factor N(5)-glutamine methyltransferase [Bacteroidota bacterium]
MIISNLKPHLFQHLLTIYPKEEIESFYKLLLNHFNLTQVDVALNTRIEFNNLQLDFIKVAIAKLKQEVPIQYILGETEFYRLRYYVDENVLIPRPETEELVDWVISDYKNNTKKLSILDIGTGSGCIAISLKKNIPNAQVFAIDISEKALEIAKKNADLNSVSINFIQSDILTATDLIENFDIIVSNPPYVRLLEKELMKPNVLNNEPSIALFVDDDNPLIFYHKISELAQKYLKNEGALYFEINQKFGVETVELLKNHHFKNIELRKDFYEVNRMIKGIK